MISMCIKELKQMFRDKTCIIFMIIAPIVLVLVFSYIMKDYINNKTNNEVLDGEKVYYLMETDGENKEKFEAFMQDISDELGVVFESADDAETAKENVKRQEGFGLVTVTDDGFDYYRSEFNESASAKLFRGVLTETMGSEKNTELIGDVPEVTIEMPKIDASSYYTFSELGFIILYISMLIAHSVFSERENRTFNRILLSKSKMPAFLFTKYFSGLFMTAVQIIVVYLFSTIVLDVDWGENAAIIMLVFLSLGFFSTSLGIVSAMSVKKRSLLDSIVMMTAILCGYMGGAFAPSSLLEEKAVIKHIIKINPLYWCNKAVITLYGGDTDNTIAKAVGVSIGVAFVLTVLYVVIYKKRKEAIQIL